MNVTVVYTFGPDVTAVYGRVEPGAGASELIPSFLAVHTERGVTEIPIDHIARIDHFDSRAEIGSRDLGPPALLHTWIAGDKCPDGLESVYDKDGLHWFRDGDDRWTDHEGRFPETWPQLLGHGPVTDRFIGLRVGR